ncbi:hypothetical protein [Streptomyces brasiliensis]|uniref:hypothetical protein n=1 Tax=Streptomyces brasiliensis TaxID=1954 RepID=UPI001E623176|nr:hypothetical protein [Streptomyces brasiliensis]
MGNNNGLGLGNNNGLGLGNNNTFGPDNNLGNFARNIVIQPSVVAGGGRITITVDGCRGGGNASSRAFRTLPLVPVNGNSDTARGVATIDNNVRPGPYDVTADCNGRTLTRPNAFTVLGGVHGGVGGSISNGATPTDMAIGGGLVSSAVVGGCVFWLRRRLEKRI